MPTLFANYLPIYLACVVSVGFLVTVASVGAPRVRLVNGDHVNILRGRVEYRYGNAWGKVCDDYWDEQDSQVVCHQLGFGSHTTFTTHTTTPRTIDAFGVDYGAYFLMDNLFCFGSEIALHHCAHNGWQNHNCLYYEVVGVYCSSKPVCVGVGGWVNMGVGVGVHECVCVCG